jgi:eukaryotic-like serine/threonine-protein kinase
VGGMGQVWAAVPVAIKGRAPAGRPVALKVMRPELARQPAMVALFLDEARLALQLRHPNIIRAHEVGVSRGRHFLVMDLIDGGDLRRLVEALELRGRRLPRGTALHIAACILRALDHAHNACDRDGQPLGIVHRDVSPPNIMIARDGDVFLGDFGVAHASGQLHISETGSCRGKMAYMAPEQRNGELVDVRADLYAVGLLIHELVTGSLPHGHEDNRETAPARAPAAHVDPVPAPGLPLGLAAILRRALRTDRSRRYADARSMLHDLEEMAEDPERARERLAGLVAEFGFVDAPGREQEAEEATPTVAERPRPPVSV